MVRLVVTLRDSPYDAVLMDPDSPPVRRQSRGIYLLPNLLTTGCLFSGFYAIVAAIDGNFERAGEAVFIAMIFDGLDGRVARLTSTETAFGKEYDSLADMVAFGRGTGDRVLSVGRGAHRRVRQGLVPLWLAGGILLRGRRGAAAGEIRFPGAGQALLRRTAEPVGRGRRCRVPVDVERVARARSARTDPRFRDHRGCRSADGVPFFLFELQGFRPDAPGALHLAGGRGAGLHRDHVRPGDRAARHLRRLCAVVAGGVGVAAHAALQAHGAQSRRCDGAP